MQELLDEISSLKSQLKQLEDELDKAFTGVGATCILRQIETVKNRIQELQVSLSGDPFDE